MTRQRPFGALGQPAGPQSCPRCLTQCTLPFALENMSFIWMRSHLWASLHRSPRTASLEDTVFCKEYEPRARNPSSSAATHRPNPGLGFPMKGHNRWIFRSLLPGPNLPSVDRSKLLFHRQCDASKCWTTDFQGGKCPEVSSYHLSIPVV